MTVMRRLREQQLILPEPPKPLGTYVPAVVAGGMLFSQRHAAGKGRTSSLDGAGWN